MPETRAARIARWLDRRTEGQMVVVALVLLAVLGTIDWISGRDLAFSVFYLLPVSMVAWRAGFRAGMVVALLAAVLWGVIDRLTGHVYPHVVYHGWNTGVRLAFFAIVSMLLAKLRASYDLQVDLAGSDPLTGAANRRTFTSALGVEIARSTLTSRPFTLVYIDLDGFKALNDRFGHAAGDLALRRLATSFAPDVRSTDVLARLGGDEFALLLPETGLEEARRRVGELRSAFEDSISGEPWSVGITAGVVSFASPPKSVAEAIDLADALMLEAKREAKGTTSLAVAAAPTGLAVTKVSGQG